LDLGGIITFLSYNMLNDLWHGLHWTSKISQDSKMGLGAITLTCTQAIVTNVWFCVSNILEQNK
jgi:hypothetical protein